MTLLFIKQVLNEAGRLKPKFYWVEKIVGNYQPGTLPSACVLLFTIACSCIFSILQWGGRAVYAPEWWTVILLTLLILLAVICKLY